jgi:hypothetical protein
MISKETFSPQWIDSIRRQERYRRVNPALFEKMVYALSLLESLAKTDFDFIFKGGTSLLLMPVSTNRFSIDLDITTSRTKLELDQLLPSIIDGSVFTSFREDKRPQKKGSVPKAHYVFEFKPSVNVADIIVLDVLFEENPYKEYTRVNIRSPWLQTTEPFTQVAIPSVNSILGDKLTAFAPATIGIPYWLGNPDKPDKRIEIIKQLYDVSLLINHCTDPVEVQDVFITLANRQITYRNLKINIEDVIADIFSAAMILARRDKNKTEPDYSRFQDLSMGLSRFESYLMTGSFHIEDAIRSSAKVACFTQSLFKPGSFSFNLYTDQFDLSELIIENPDYNFLNRLKKTSKEAFYYWFKCLNMLGLVEN